MSKSKDLIKQDGIDGWNPSFFQMLSESEAIEKISKVNPNIKRSTVTAVWKQANGKSKPNPEPKAKEGESKED